MPAPPDAGKGEAPSLSPPPSLGRSQSPPPWPHPSGLVCLTAQTAGKTAHWCCLEPRGLWPRVGDGQTPARVPGTSTPPARHCGHNLHPPLPHKHTNIHPGTRESSCPAASQAQRGCRDHTKHPRNRGAFPELQVPGISRGPSHRAPRPVQSGPPSGGKGPDEALPTPQTSPACRPLASREVLICQNKVQEVGVWCW